LTLSSPFSDCGYLSFVSFFLDPPHIHRYDVYTPTRNIVFHDYGLQANQHGNNEWFKRQRDRFRQASIVRVKTALQIPGGEPDINDQANLGIYGLGKRRTMEQLNAFVGLNLQSGAGNSGKICTGHEWVPYDSSISPTDNLFSNPDNLDPQPEYPFRTNLIYYQPPVATLTYSLMRESPLTSDGINKHVSPTNNTTTSNHLPSMGVLLFLWLFGILVWFIVFTRNSLNVEMKQSRPSVVRRKSSDVYKDV
jgi:Glycosyltransferase (GlcNAc)